MTILIIASSGCGAQPVAPAEQPRGEVNGHSFDFVSIKPKSEWTIRLRGNSMWVAYSSGQRFEDLGTYRLTEREIKRLWQLVDLVDVPTRDEGALDDDEGGVVLRLRVPGEDEHELYVTYVHHDDDDREVIALAKYLRSLIEQHSGRRARL